MWLFGAVTGQIAGNQILGLFADLHRIPSWMLEGSLHGHGLMSGDCAPKRKGYLTPNPSSWAGGRTGLLESSCAVSDKRKLDLGQRRKLRVEFLNSS